MSEIVEFLLTLNREAAEVNRKAAEENLNKYNLGYLHHRQRLYRVFEGLCKMYEEVEEQGEEVSWNINSHCTMHLAICDGYYDIVINSETPKKPMKVFEVQVCEFDNKIEPIDRELDEDEIFDKFYEKFTAQYNFEEEQEFIVYQCEHCMDRVSTKEGGCKYCVIKSITLKEPCPICLEAGEGIWKKLNRCSHVFHAKCLHKLPTVSPNLGCVSCPLCRTANLIHMAKII